MSSDYDPHDKFYNGLEREQDFDTRKENILTKLSELLARNNFTVEQVTEEKRGKFQCRTTIKDKDGMIIYDLLSDIMTGHNRALLNVMSKIVNLSESIKPEPGSSSIY